MSEHAHLIRVTTVHPADGRRDEVVALAEKMAAEARSIDGCFGVQVCAVKEEPEWVAVVSRWEDTSAVSRLEALIASNGDRLRELIREQPRTYEMTPL